MPDAHKIQVTCAIAGGGPAGMMLGLLLARSGVPVLVLEKHSDFLRDFRGDTIHPSTMEVLHELGILDQFLKRPHQEVTQVSARIGDDEVTVGDFSHLPTTCKFLALMPQWDFLKFLEEHAHRYPAFQLRMEAEVVDIIQSGDRVSGLKVKTSQGEFDVEAKLSISADGRHSIVREKAGLEIIQRGAPMDVLWMRVSRKPSDPGRVLGRVNAGQFLVTIDRDDYWQCGMVIPKGSFEEVKGKGLESLREDIAGLAPFLRERLGELQSWDDVKLLTVAVDRLRRWYRPGLLCIGDSAHAMSPIGGVGINLAIQDAVAAANILAPALRKGLINPENLHRVQQRRELPTRLTQSMQVFLQNRFVRPVLAKRGRKIQLPLALKLIRRWPLVQRLPARLIGIGFRPEHLTIRGAPAVEPGRSGSYGSVAG